MTSTKSNIEERDSSAATMRRRRLAPFSF